MSKPARRFSQAEDATICTLWTTKGAVEIGRKLGVGESVVRRRADELGLPRQKSGPRHSYQPALHGPGQPYHFPTLDELRADHAKRFSK